MEMRRVLLLSVLIMSASVVFAATGVDNDDEAFNLDALKLLNDTIVERDNNDAGRAVYFMNSIEIQENDELAMSTLKTIAVAAETYTTEHDGDYPLKIEDLTEADEPFLDEKYCGETIEGFRYECEFAIDGYRLSAIPVERRRTGIATFIVTTKLEK